MYGRVSLPFVTRPPSRVGGLREPRLLENMHPVVRRTLAMRRAGDCDRDVLSRPKLLTVNGRGAAVQLKSRKDCKLKRLTRLKLQYTI